MNEFFKFIFTDVYNWVIGLITFFILFMIVLSGIRTIIESSLPILLDKLTAIIAVTLEAIKKDNENN